jgi:hypothetical protein
MAERLFLGGPRLRSSGAEQVCGTLMELKLENWRLKKMELENGKEKWEKKTVG